MTPRRYFRASLWLPLVMPVIALVLTSLYYLQVEPRPPVLIGRPRVESPGALLQIGVVLMYSVPAGGLAYVLVFVPIFWWLSAIVPERRLTILALAAPLLFTFGMAGQILLLELLQYGDLRGLRNSDVPMGILLFSFGLSFAYALVVLCGYRFAIRRGWILASE